MFNKPASKKIYSRINLNLLYPQGIQQKLPIRFLRWLISYGRFIVVAVEIVVLVCFAFRFKLDAELADLKEKINSQVPFLESLTADEAIIKQTQLRLKNIQISYTRAPIWKQTISEIASQTPPDVKLTSVNLGNPQVEGNSIPVKIAARTPSNNMLAVFVMGLKNDAYFKEINLTSVSFEDGLILFTVTGSTK